MKAVWKEKFDVDIDGLEVDFAQFNMTGQVNLKRLAVFFLFRTVSKKK